MLAIDSSYQGIYGALGHSFFMMRDFNNGMQCYERALRRDSAIVDYSLEYGLCVLNEGDVQRGVALIEQVLSGESNRDVIDKATASLITTSKLAFEYGEGCEYEGNLKEGLASKQYAIEVLQVAHQLDQSNQKVIQYIVDFS